MKVEIFTESIKLSQLLKYSGVVFSGAEAKNVIKKGMVSVNKEVQTASSRMVFPGDLVEFDGFFIEIEKKDEN